VSGCNSYQLTELQCGVDETTYYRKNSKGDATPARAEEHTGRSNVDILTCFYKIIYTNIYNSNGLDILLHSSHSLLLLLEGCSERLRELISEKPVYRVFVAGNQVYTFNSAILDHFSSIDLFRASC
jgi:hypothetical protein